MEKTFRLNCTAATFPLLSSWFGRSTITRSADDTNYVITNAYSGTQADRDIGIPMPIYMHNVLPTSQGLMSVDYKRLVQGGVGSYKQAFIWRLSGNSRIPFCPETGSFAYGDVWVQAPGLPTPRGFVTKAYLHHKTYVALQGQGLWTFNEQLGQFQQVFVQGIHQSAIEGVCYANNYLIVYTKDTIHWSSAIDPEDMRPALDSTAGSNIPLPIRGSIVCCLPISDGFIIYTAANAVLAKYSGNVRMPWQYVEISGVGGVVDPAHVTSESNNELHYAWTTQGMATIGKGATKGDGVFPEVTDFLSGHLIEDYIGETGAVANSNTSHVWSSETQSLAEFPLGANNLAQYTSAGRLQIKLCYIGNRWFTVSYGVDFLHYVLVFDTQLKRWGKLRKRHTDVLEWSVTVNQTAQQEVNHQFALLQEDGTVLQVNLEAGAGDSDSVLIFGRLQHTRNKVLTMHAFEVENAAQASTVLTLLTSLDGRNWLPAKPVLPQIQTRYLSKWLMRSTGINHCFKLTGIFDITSLQGSCSIGGFR